MNTITITYTLVWQHSDYPNYQFTKCKKCFNVSRGKELKMIMIGGSIGFCIAGKFQSLAAIRNKLTKIKNEDLPF
jgi:hypothetical protein